MGGRQPCRRLALRPHRRGPEAPTCARRRSRNVAGDQIRVVVTSETEKGLKVSDYAKKVSAIAAINGDYFDDHFNPVGYTIGPCGPWASTKDMKREIVLQIANQRGFLRRRTELADTPTDPVDAAISGLPARIASTHSRF